MPHSARFEATDRSMPRVRITIICPSAFIAVAIATGLVLGLINGSLVAWLGIPPIVVTLGTLAIFRGMIVVYGGGNQVNASEMGDVFQSFPKVTFFGLSTIFWIMAAVAIAAR